MCAYIYICKHQVCAYKKCLSYDSSDQRNLTNQHGTRCTKKNAGTKLEKCHINLYYWLVLVCIQIFSVSMYTYMCLWYTLCIYQYIYRVIYIYSGIPLAGLLPLSPASTSHASPATPTDVQNAPQRCRWVERQNPPVSASSGVSCWVVAVEVSMVVNDALSWFCFGEGFSWLKYVEMILLRLAPDFWLPKLEGGNPREPHLPSESQNENHTSTFESGLLNT